MLAATALAPTSLSAQAVVSNTAAATYETIGGTDSVGTNTVLTNLVFPDLTVEKLVTGPTSVRIGDEITYTIRYENASATVPAIAASLSDTLPAGLEYVSSQPAAQVTGQIVTWDLADVAAGASGQVAVTVRVASTIRDTVRVQNVAVLTALNAAAELGRAAEVELVGVLADQLALEKSVDALEVGLGETVPYTLTLENTGVVSVADLRIHDLLPEGGRYAKGSAIGVDSVQANGRELTLYIAGPLAPGETLTIRYAVAIVSAESEVLTNRAYATAENEFVRSEETVAWVRVRRSAPMETRAAIGKVWVDLDGDGRQDGNEPGVAGVDIWTEDGQVATTDGDGKFSFQNVRPGRHAFRLDRTTVPVSHRFPGTGSSEDLVVLDADGWTTPRINFRVVPSTGTVEQVSLPVSYKFTARPLRQQPQAVARGTGAERTTLARFETNESRPILDFRNRFLPLMLAQTLAERPECRVEIGGHADYRRVTSGPFPDNWQLSAARADSVAFYLKALGITEDQVATEAYGSTQPLMDGRDRQSLWLNRRGEVQLVCAEYLPEKPVVEYELVVTNGYDIPLEGLKADFHPTADSAQVLDGDSVIARHSSGGIALPSIAQRSQLIVRAWTTPNGDSAAVALESTGVLTHQLMAAVHNPLMPVEGISRVRALMSDLPSPERVPAGETVELVLAPSRSGWPTVVYLLPDGWDYVDGTSRLGDAAAPDPATDRDRTGQPSLSWSFEGRSPAPVSLHLRPVGAAAPVEPVTVPALRSPEEREADKGRAFLAGPGVEVLQPQDGTVLRSDRTYVGVQGEAGAPVALFDGDSLLAEVDLRVDGIYDFIAVPLSRGPHRLRVRMRNSWQQERWDSVSVHVTGLAAQFVAPAEPIRLTADGHTRREVRIRVVDEWGVPVVHPTNVTVSAEGATIASADADPSSAGMQVQSDAAGWLHVALEPGRDVGYGSLLLKSGKATQEVALELLAASRPLMLTGVGRLGFGASPEAFGAITARGRLDDRTSVVLSYDSRNLDAGRDAFGRTIDPLDEAQYPIMGDASQERTLSASRYAFAARIERGLDWLAVGDISTSDFASGLRLTTYQRSLAGGAARVTTGPVVWRGFGSLTTQNLQQLQIRGAGTSGPYELLPNVIPGTEQVVIETRALENAERVVARQALVRFVDYQIDYERGTILFKRPIPASDAFDNHVFLMVTYEVDGGGERRLVGGIRGTVDAGGLIGASYRDALQLGVTGIYADEPTGGEYLTGADLRLLRTGLVDLGAEVSYSQTPDSSGLAGRIDGSLHLFRDALNLSAGWMKVGSGFGNPSNTALRGVSDEIMVGAEVKVGPTALRFKHSRQSFGAEGVDREQTRAGIVQSIGPNLQFDAMHSTERFESVLSTDRSQAGEVALHWTPVPSLRLWAEGRHLFEYTGTLVSPDHVGGGLAWQVDRHVSLELRHRQVLPPGGTERYQITNLGVRSDLGFGIQAFGSYELAGGAGGSHNAAVVGLNNQLQLGPWRINAMFERRMGVSQAPLADPVRALPFAQTEEDYWSGGLGIELTPDGAPYRLSARGEYRDGTLRSLELVTVAGDIALNRSLALLTRQEFLRTEQERSGEPTLSRRLASLWGMALRPIGTDALNLLAKFSWLKESNPLGGGVLTTEGEEQRLIGAAEAILAPTGWSELAVRYAVRHTQSDRLISDSLTQRLESWADYLGGRLEIGALSWLAVRAEGRLLMERTSDTRRWDAAPSLVLLPIAGLEVAGGYRFGDLSDPDFAVRGGHGWFVTASVRITERIFPTAADFWRPRLDR
ncbi:MAG: DUF11 domain-containing protein [Gemmatimonadota bacterium]|nr:MAG: DUF11 domain-containing protein [Gemmatimonadota bacterium]